MIVPERIVSALHDRKSTIMYVYTSIVHKYTIHSMYVFTSIVYNYECYIAYGTCVPT